MVARLEVGEQIILKSAHIAVAMVRDVFDLAGVDLFLEARQAAGMVGMRMGHDDLLNRSGREFTNTTHLFFVLFVGRSGINENPNLRSC